MAGVGAGGSHPDDYPARDPAAPDVGSRTSSSMLSGRAPIRLVNQPESGTSSWYDVPGAEAGRLGPPEREEVVGHSYHQVDLGPAGAPRVLRSGSQTRDCRDRSGPVAERELKPPIAAIETAGLYARVVVRIADWSRN